jgi:hypothetical protein
MILISPFKPADNIIKIFTFQKETPPADYEMTEKHAAGGGHRMAAY